MFFDQINTPANLPIYIFMHLVNRKLLGRLYHTLRARLFFLLYNKAFLLNLRNVTQLDERQVTLWSLIHTAKHIVTWCICVTACFELEFSCCVSCYTAVYPALHPSSPACKWELGLTDELQIQCGPKCTHAICDNLSQGTLLLKGTKTNSPSMLMPKAYHFLWFLCYILVQFPPYSRRTVWNIRQEAVWGHVFPIT